MKSLPYIFLLSLSSCYYYSGAERISELPEHYSITVRIWRADFNPASKDTLFKPVYGSKYLDTDSALVVTDKISILTPGSYKVRVECKWQNANPGLRIIAELSSWNSFVKFPEHDGGETVFEQTLDLQEPLYIIKLGVTNGFTPETDNPSLLKTTR